MVTIKGDIEEIERAEGKTEVIFPNQEQIWRLFVNQINFSKVSSKLKSRDYIDYRVVRSRK